jgi:hypothetical protein
VKLASTAAGFGRIEGDAFVPIGVDLVAFLQTGHVAEGSGVGMARVPQRWLRDGQRMTVEIDRIGKLTNTVRMRGGTT